MMIRSPRLVHLDDDDDLGGGGGISTEPPEDMNPLDADPDGDGTEERQQEQGPDDGLDEIFGNEEEAAPGTGDEPAATGSRNPAIQALLSRVEENLPMGLHSLVVKDLLEPELAKMQKGFDEQLKQFEPYRDLTKNKVNMDTVTAALGMAQWINDNPGEALQQIAQVARTRGLDPATVLGVQIAQQAQNQQQVAPDLSGKSQEELDLIAIFGENPPEGAVELMATPAFQAIAKQLAEVQTQQAQFQQTFQTQEQQQEQARAREEHSAIETALNTVKQGFAARREHFNDKAVMQYAVNYVNSLPEAERQIDPLIAIKAGAAAWRKDTLAAAAALNKRAPRMGGGSASIGGAAAPAPKPKETLQDRMAKFKSNAEAILHGGD